MTRLASFGAFVEVLPGKEGLVRTSEAALENVSRIEDVMNVGDEVLVKVIEIDHMGLVNLSRRQALGGSPASREFRGERDGGRGDRRPGWRRDVSRNSRDRDRLH